MAAAGEKTGPGRFLCKGPTKADHNSCGWRGDVGGGGDFENKFPTSACQKKKIACGTKVIESLWEKKGKNILPTRFLEKNILDDQKSRPPASRVKRAAPK